MIDWRLTLNSMPYLLTGAWVTLYLTLLAMAIALVAGLAGALARMSRFALLRLIAGAYIEFMRGTPLLVQLLIAFFGLPQIGINLTPFQAAVGTLGLCGGAYTAEIFRGGIIAVNKGQFEAAQSLGMHYWYTMRLVVLPQAIRVVLPPLSNEFVTLLKDSSLVSVIGMTELVRRGQYVISRTFDPFSIYLGIALVYLALTYVTSHLLRAVERRLAY